MGQRWEGMEHIWGSNDRALRHLSVGEGGRAKRNSKSLWCFEVRRFYCLNPSRIQSFEIIGIDAEGFKVRMRPDEHVKHVFTLQTKLPHP